jgi:hypothetical protein
VNHAVDLRLAPFAVNTLARFAATICRQQTVNPDARRISMGWLRQAKKWDNSKSKGIPELVDELEQAGVEFSLKGDDLYVLIPPKEIDRAQGHMLKINTYIKYIIPEVRRRGGGVKPREVYWKKGQTNEAS